MSQLGCQQLDCGTIRPVDGASWGWRMRRSASLSRASAPPSVSNGCKLREQARDYPLLDQGGHLARGGVRFLSAAGSQTWFTGQIIWRAGVICRNEMDICSLLGAAIDAESKKRRLWVAEYCSGCSVCQFPSSYSSLFSITDAAALAGFGFDSECASVASVVADLSEHVDVADKEIEQASSSARLSGSDRSLSAGAVLS